MLSLFMGFSSLWLIMQPCMFSATKGETFSSNFKTTNFKIMLTIVLATSLLATSPALVTAAVVSSTPAQTFVGIGGSGAWWPNELFSFPEAVRQNLSTLLFSQSGLGISNYRYNVGGGGVGVTNPVRAPETFYVSPGVYDFSADPQGVYFMEQAAAHGVHSFTAFVNSAPPQLTSNGASCGGTFVNGTAV
jgi:hypothetical protein